MTPSIRPFVRGNWTMLGIPGYASQVRVLNSRRGGFQAFGPDAPVLVRVATAAVVGVAAAVAVGVSVGWPYAPAAGWIVTAIIYLVSTWALIARMNAEQTRDHACRPHEQDATRGWSHAIMLLASIASLAGVGYLLMAETSKGGDLVAAAVGILSVAASWFAVHTVFTLRYARLYYTGRRNGIDFHQDGTRPTPISRTSRSRSA